MAQVALTLVGGPFEIIDLEPKIQAKAVQKKADKIMGLSASLTSTRPAPLTKSQNNYDKKAKL
ncbi:MAG: hypothetical protein LBE80_07595 [Deltaproteobacteria bacterium]|jgi:hypothetical protein|nr:hypothetical protein [Deltaproteobacteria bacterium]